MSIVEKYGLAHSADPATLVKFDEVMRGIVEKVNAPSPAEVSADNKRTDILAEKYGKDEVGAKDATDFLRSSDILSALAEYADDDPARTFHLFNALKDTVVPYFQTECAYFRLQAQPKSVGSNEKAVLRADFNALRKLFNKLASVVAMVDEDYSSDFVEKLPNGDAQYKVRGFRGPNPNSGEAHGKFAPVYRLAWTIDGEDIAAGTQLSDIVRALWHGADRIGKSAKDLAEMLDQNVPAWKKPEMPETSFALNGHEVVIYRPDTDEDEDEKK